MVSSEASLSGSTLSSKEDISGLSRTRVYKGNKFEPRHEIFNNVVLVCATSKASDTLSLI